MPEPLTPHDLVGAASSVSGADFEKMRAVLRDVRERAAQRSRELLRNRLDERPPRSTRESPRPKSAAAPHAIPRVSPDRPLEIRLQSGRTVRATVAPAVARRHDLIALGRVSAANDRRAVAAIERQNAALEALRRSHEDLSKQVTALQQQANLARTHLLQGLAGFKVQLHAAKGREQTIRGERLSVRMQAIRQQRQLQSLVATSRIQQVTAVVSSLQSTAYGQKGSILATNNLLLAANQLLWVAIDPLLRRFGMLDGPSPSLVTWLSPLGSLATGHLALGNRQHVRFISGVATFDGTTDVVSEPLRDRIGDDVWADFVRRTDVPVTVIPLDPKTGAAVTGTVQQGVLEIRLSPPPSPPPPPPPPGLLLAAVVSQQPPRVAWMVDVGPDLG